MLLHGLQTYDPRTLLYSRDDSRHYMLGLCKLNETTVAAKVTAIKYNPRIL